MSKSTGIGDDVNETLEGHGVPCPAPAPGIQEPGSPGGGVYGRGDTKSWGGRRGRFRTHRGRVQRGRVLEQCQRHPRQTVPLEGGDYTLSQRCLSSCGSVF